MRREDAFREKPANAKDEKALSQGPENGNASENGQGPATVPGTRIESLDAYLESVEPDKEAPESAAGVLARAEVDGDHWLGAGVAKTINVLVRGQDIPTCKARSAISASRLMMRWKLPKRSTYRADIVVTKRVCF
ncbi:MAG: hypothetical protein IID51_11400 [Proteobacteria bacterium]|nr:hypothetical protein [Pseudomonadota bacterium]